MRAMFSLLNFVIGLFSLAVGFGNFQMLAHSMSSASAGLIALVIGATCLWLARESVFFKPRSIP
ncbi:hypothetical protein GALL_340110 [mine drainage metagenome]|uniref:Uncharacterized protein n=1 Tax=mine drainage metagenome TaxID=410659 RepID=A0A1J5R7P8_9ZZZZ